MDIPSLHEWPLDTTAARALQTALAGSVNVHRSLATWRTIAGADVSYNKFDPRLFAAVVVVAADTLEVIERVGVKAQAAFPYVPGLLSFREAPPVLEAFRRLTVVPDVVLCDGQGIAHPRRFGLACHLGLWLGLPTIGVAKSWLCGEFADPGPDRGDRSPLIDQGDVVGAVLRSRSRVKPLFVSPGHLCDLDSAVAVVLGATVTYRLPVPARLAHGFVNDLRREAGQPPSDPQAASESV